MTTYEDVEKAIEAVPARPSLFTPGTNADKWIVQWEDYNKWLAEAWRAYAMFLEERVTPYPYDSVQIEKAKALVASKLT